MRLIRKAIALLLAGILCLCPAVSGFTEESPEVVGFSTNGEKTIKNYLLGAMIPVGKVLYVWGGGWNNSTTIGLTKTQTNWYKSQSSNYDYHSCNDLSVTNRAKGFDCSGYVGWCAYQVMYNNSGQGGGYTVVSGEIGGTYKARGWGKTLNQNYLASHDYMLKPGDIGYNSGHAWIVVGQCRDKSVVLVHSTPQAGVQLSGTTTPDGNYDSEAAALAKAYMQKYYASSLQKYEYHPSVGNYILQYGFFRWNRETLADPDKYMSMTADEILRDLFALKSTPPVPDDLPKTGDSAEPARWLGLILLGLAGLGGTAAAKHRRGGTEQRKND